MNNETKKIHSAIINERMKIKSELNLLSFFAKGNKIHEEKINYLLDRLSYLEELEEKIKKMK